MWGLLVWKSRFGRAVSRGTLVRFRFGSPLSCRHCLETLSRINETFKWLSMLMPILIYKSHSGGESTA